jgi:hypothetical protein
MLNGGGRQSLAVPLSVIVATVEGEDVEPQAIKDARASVAKAEASLVVMRGAKSYAEFKSGWSDFLLAAGRIYTKLEQGAKSNSKSSAWFGARKHERRTDPLLTYIWHARNVDKHGLKLLEGSARIAASRLPE